MNLIRKLLAFTVAFAVVSCSVTVMAAVYEEETPYAAEAAEGTAPAIEDEDIYPDLEVIARSEDKAPAQTALQAYTPRLKAPAKTNQYYYSDKNVFYKYNYGMPNCTCYAWGRAYELLGEEPDLSVYSAYLWYDYNKDNRLYAYGQTPKLGAIACWVYSSGTSGHVAVVERIEKDKITFSNSAYGGEEFYLSTAPVNDPSDGRSTWIFQGYIYIGEYAPPADSADSAATGDVYRITSDNGVNMRSGAGTSYAIVGGVGYGKDVTVTKTKKADGYTWGYTTYGGRSGWLVLDFAKLIYKKTEASSATVTVTDKPKPTAAPTTAPTAAPKTSPTTAPKAPTQAPTAAPTEPQEQPVRYLMGDVDGDGVITIFDATRIQRILAELVVPTDYMLMVGDYDGDSCLTIFDAAQICRDLVRGRI